MPSAKVTSKGQITIPAAVRKALGLKQGTQIDFYESEPGTFVLRAKTGSIMDMKGCLPRLGYAPTIEEMDEAVGKAAAEEYLRSIAPEHGTEREGEAA
ncbi:MAG: AbrB/MazE/SpoVT family DNA-binding domain-containing protein [Terracidiphilus sp.]